MTQTSREKYRMSNMALKNGDVEGLAKIFAKIRGQEGREVSEKDMELALEMIQNKNKKFMNGK